MICVNVSLTFVIISVILGLSTFVMFSYNSGKQEVKDQIEQATDAGEEPARAVYRAFRGHSFGSDPDIDLDL